ncbi:response regulator transcription factor [Paenibacillus sp. y28]|uniref:response regulator transcription factor n=1 Tax=Paenibacillus sp. y28 TaxID=3129110 RepID=UPI0030161289
MRILLVEDDTKLGMLIEYKLRQQFHTVDWAQHAEEAEHYMDLGSYDAYILDWMIPGRSGVELCRMLRAKGDRTPVLMLTARDAVPDRVEGLHAGADDYLVKPFAFEELEARLLALGRRNVGGWSGNVSRLGEVLELNHVSHEVKRDGQPVTLTRREFQMLEVLIRYQGQIIPRERLMDQVWGMEAEVTPNTMDATVKLLRKKIDDPFPDKIIHNVRGIGYRLALKE